MLFGTAKLPLANSTGWQLLPYWGASRLLSVLHIVNHTVSSAEARSQLMSMQMPCKAPYQVWQVSSQLPHTPVHRLHVMYINQ